MMSLLHILCVSQICLPLTPGGQRKTFLPINLWPGDSRVKVIDTVAIFQVSTFHWEHVFSLQLELTTNSQYLFFFIMLKFSASTVIWKNSPFFPVVFSWVFRCYEPLNHCSTLSSSELSGTSKKVQLTLADSFLPTVISPSFTNNSPSVSVAATSTGLYTVRIW